MSVAAGEDQAYRVLVILDVVMPDLSGWETLRRIRQFSQVSVMLLSGRASDVDKARGLDLGADDYLTKPFSYLEFEARVRALLRRTRRPLGANGR
jgi:two-component system copper resistance phosphate regulon response regulator CusR